MAKEYKFTDLFDADKNLNEEGQNKRAKILVNQLVELETLYPSK